jgi:hypothetical protein
MTTLEKCLLGGGLFFPALSLLTVLASVVTRWRSGRHASAALVPFVGPVLLTCWILLRDYSSWFILLVWLSDMGTVMFLAVLPWLIREWWRTSVFTRTMILHGTQGIQRAVITIHSSGRYLLKKSWDRPSSETGIVGLGEPGSFVADGEAVTLVSDHGLRRKLRRVTRDAYDVEEPEEDRPELRDYSLRGWRLECREHHVVRS